MPDLPRPTPADLGSRLVDLDALEHAGSAALDDAVPPGSGAPGRARVDATHVAALERAHAVLAQALDEVDRG